MARVINNNILKGIRGRIGNMVVRQVGDRTIVSMAPRATKKPPSPLQVKHNLRFQEAVAYANSIKHDAAKVKQLKKTMKKGQTVFNAAFSEFMRSTKAPQPNKPVKTSAWRSIIKFFS